MKATIGTRIFILAIFLCSLILVQGVASHSILKKSTLTFQKAHQAHSSRLNQIDEIRNHFQELKLSLLSAAIENVQDQKLDVKRAEFSRKMTEMDQEFSSMQSDEHASGEAEEIKTIENSWEEFSKFGMKIAETKAELQRVQTEEVQKIQNQIDSALNRMHAFHRERLKQRFASANDYSEISSARISIIFSVLFLIGLVFSFFQVRNLGNRLKKGLEELHETRKKFTKINDHFLELGDQIESAIHQQNQEAGKISSFNEQVVERTMVLSETAKTIQQASQQSVLAVGDSQESIHELKKTMNRLNDHFAKTEQLQRLIEEVRNKSAILDEVVHQSRLLSFNASSEMDHTGSDHSKRFIALSQDAAAIAQLSIRAAFESSESINKALKEIRELIGFQRLTLEQGDVALIQAESRIEIIDSAVRTFDSKLSELIQVSESQYTEWKQFQEGSSDMKVAFERNITAISKLLDDGKGIASQFQKFSKTVSGFESMIQGGSVRTRSEDSDHVLERHYSKVMNLPQKKKSQQVKEPMKDSVNEPVKEPVKMVVGNGSEPIEPDVPEDPWDKI